MRRKTNARRLKGGKLARPTTRKERTAHDHGNIRCVERLGWFHHPMILAGKAAWVDIYDGIGQLHAIGMLDGHGIDGKLMRDAGREYAGLYNYTYIDMLPKGSDLERVYGGGGSGKSDDIPKATKRDMRFAQMDALLPVGSQERYWTHKILLDNFGLDRVTPLVDRLVNYKFAQWRLPTIPAGERDMRLAGDDDFLNLACLLRGLFALADGAMPMRRAA